MRQQRVYVFWSERPGSLWHSYYCGRVLLILKDRDRYSLRRTDYTELGDYPSLNLAKRAGSKWLREQAGEKVVKAKPGGGRPR